MGVYSVDPSGAWRHWASGCTAIGRTAWEVRQELCKQFHQNVEKKNPLKIAFQALLQATQSASFNQDDDQYDAIFIWIDNTSSSGVCQVARVDPQLVRECRKELGELLLTAKL